MNDPLFPRTTARRRVSGVAMGIATVLGASVLAACSPGSDEADENRLRFAYAFAPTTALSPYSDDATTAYAAGATETLVRLDAEGLPEPSLATSWEQIDPTTWRFELREDVTFHDGTELDADAVVAALDHAAAAEPAPRALAGGQIDAETDPDDDRAVIVTTAAEDPVLVQRV